MAKKGCLSDENNTSYSQKQKNLSYILIVVYRVSRLSVITRN